MTPSAAPAPGTPAAQPAAAEKSGGRGWYKADLHTHTPASNDYEQPAVSYLEWLRTAAERGLDIVAVTDHNTVAGVAAIRHEIEWLIRLKQQGRLTESERETLAEWSELSNRVLVLPGFEFTATFGFHILGIFPPTTSVRTLEHILLTLKVPPEKIDIGSTETGSTTDVLTAYKVIREAGGLAIAAHANSTHGVAMRNFPFGGQTKIAYTQDVNLDALEVTDLENRAHSTARFFNGSKSEYPRRMHAIQGSDAHRLSMDPRNPKRLGVGERATEFMLDDPSFEALAAVLRSTQWERTRPARPKDRPLDPLFIARAEGNNAIQGFHESAHRQGGKLDAVLADLCGFANGAGGTVYVGMSLRSDGPRFIARPRQVEEQIIEAVEARLTPPIELQIDTVPVDAGGVLRLRVARGDERPYAVDGHRIVVRAGASSVPATRDEIVAMVLESAGTPAEAPPLRPLQPQVPQQAQSMPKPAPAPAPKPVPATQPKPQQAQQPGKQQGRQQPARPATQPAGGRQAAQPARPPAQPILPPVQPILPPMPPILPPLQPPVQPILPPEQLILPPTPVVESPAVTGAARPVAEAPAPAKGRKRVAKAPAEAAPVVPAAAAAAALVAAAPTELPPAELPPAALLPPAKPARSRSKKSTPAAAAALPAAPEPAAPEPAALILPDKAAEEFAAVEFAAAEFAALVPPPPAAPAKPARKSSTRAKAAPVEPAPATAPAPAAPAPAAPAKRTRKSSAALPAAEAAALPVLPPTAQDYAPQIGVEIIESELRNGAAVHTIRDLRNGNTVRNVSRKGARDLWSYAIARHEEAPVNPDALVWHDDTALIYAEQRAGKMRYDLALREPAGVRVFYGVTADGMPGRWARYIQDEA